MRYEILNCFTDAVIYTADIECADDAPEGVKLGMAAQAAVKDGVSLYRASIDGANLAGANLDGANLDGARLVGASLDGAKVTRLVARATRLDGYEFFGFDLDDGRLFIRAGCRSMTLADYRKHIAAEYPGTHKAVETTDILDFIEKRAQAGKVS